MNRKRKFIEINNEYGDDNNNDDDDDDDQVSKNDNLNNETKQIVIKRRKTLFDKQELSQYHNQISTENIVYKFIFPFFDKDDLQVRMFFRSVSIFFKRIVDHWIKKKVIEIGNMYIDDMNKQYTPFNYSRPYYIAIASLGVGYLLFENYKNNHQKICLHQKQMIRAAAFNGNSSFLIGFILSRLITDWVRIDRMDTAILCAIISHEYKTVKKLLHVFIYFDVYCNLSMDRYFDRCIDNIKKATSSYKVETSSPYNRPTWVFKPFKVDKKYNKKYNQKNFDNCKITKIITKGDYNKYISDYYTSTSFKETYYCFSLLYYNFIIFALLLEKCGIKTKLYYQAKLLEKVGSHSLSYIHRIVFLVKKKVPSFQFNGSWNSILKKMEKINEFNPYKYTPPKTYPLMHL